MDNSFEVGAPKGAFFRKIDWAAFWTATVVAFVVYFLTLPPSVTLEDSGEFIVAGDHWGVPHPPGYPIWTFCANLMSDLFRWVTFRGQTTPAWSIALMSAVFGALAAGLTAMLITRSSSDLLKGFRRREAGEEEAEHDGICWAGGVAGSLLFAFSPVMWSQSVIVEAYALNAFFLVWLFLLTYRWMRRPSERVLWLAAYIFGLGLTNYQVMLLALVPLAIVIMLRDVKLFRDFLFAGIPLGLSLLTLKVGALLSDLPVMSAAQAKMAGVPEAEFRAALMPGALAGVPSNGLLVAGLVVFGLGVVLALVMEWRERRGDGEMARLKLPVVAGMLGAGAVLMVAAQVAVGQVEIPNLLLFATPPVSPGVYARLGMWAMMAAGGLLVAGLARPQRKWSDPWVVGGLIAAGVAVVVGFMAGGMGDAVNWMRVDPESLAKFKSMMGLLKGGLLLGGLVMLALGWFTPRGVLYAGIVLVVQGVWITLMGHGAALGLTHPATWWFWWPVAWNFILLGLVWLLLPNGRQVALTIFFAELGVAFYIYMPIASDGNPPMNWAYTRTWEGFKHGITRGQYEAIAPLNPFTNFGKFLSLIGGYFTDLRTQFTLMIVPLTLLPFTLWSVLMDKGRRFRMLYVGAGLYAVVALLAAVGRWTMLDETVRVDKFVLLLLAVVAAGGMVIMVVQEVIAIFNAIFSRKEEEEEGELVKTDLDAVGRQWLLAIMAGFLVMSVLLIILADPKGDLQDNFIQKVKYISSHGLLTLWVGYGLVLGLVVGEHLLQLLKAKYANAPVKLLRTGMICAALMSAGIPIYENYTNDALVFELGSAEQNGHDYGWQFGNYQLRGADAITEELENEEPLPDPTFPPAMDYGAIFFGGTDPGRFVPTYMIYSAYVRPDVFLITQNALADQTYMNIMRDLMGNDIWMPTPDDSSWAFQKYVSDVESGARPRPPDLLTVNGRIQVTGALAVMEINGILCDMLFKRNKNRHAFYVEESYAIDWMFDYFTPHGLIMKLNAEKTRPDAANIRQDMDFWDWYTRRLTRDVKYRRDFVAQKSFSKLRTSIAGMYAKQRRPAEAEKAYREALNLYPASPEAAFRLVQEIYLLQNRVEDAYDTIAEFHRLDPKNKNGANFIEILAAQVNGKKRIDTLLEKIKATPREQWLPADLIELAESYFEFRMSKEAVYYAVILADRADTPKEILCRAALILSSAKQDAAAVRALDRAIPQFGQHIPEDVCRVAAQVYLNAAQYKQAARFLSAYVESRPAEWRMTLQLALVYLELNQTRDAQNALLSAVRSGGRDAEDYIQSNPALKALAAKTIRTAFPGLK